MGLLESTHKGSHSHPLRMDLRLLDTAGQFRDLLPLPPLGYLAISVTAVQVRAGQHEVVGNMCCSNTSSETVVKGVMDQPESDPATTALITPGWGQCPRETNPGKAGLPCCTESGFLLSLQDCKRVPA